MLIHCWKNEDATAAAKFFNELSVENGWKLFAAPIHGALSEASHGGLSDEDVRLTKEAYKYPKTKDDVRAWKNGDPMPGGGRIVDVGVQCMTLGEGYDNPWQGLVPPYTCARVSLSRGPGRKPGASSYTRKHLSLSLTGARAKAWCLLIHAEASLSHGGQGEKLVSPYTRGSVSLSRGAE